MGRDVTASKLDHSAQRARDFWNTVSRVHDQTPLAGDRLVVELVVVGEDQHTIGGAELLLGRLHGLEVSPVYRKQRHVWVGVEDLRSLAAKRRDDFVGGGFSGVTDPAPVGDAQHEDAGALEGASLLVEGFPAG